MCVCVCVYDTGWHPSFGEKRLTGAVFLELAKAFDTVWIDGLFTS